MSRSDPLCRDRSYPTKHLSHLPQVYRLSAGLSATLDYARESQIPACQQMIQDAAHRGDNIGTDEFSEYKFTLFFGIAELFAVRTFQHNTSPDDVRSTRAENVVAFIAIVPARFARCLSDKVLAGLYVFRSAELESDDEAYQSLVRLGVTLIPQLELGYTVVAMETAMTRRPGIIRALRAEGFQISVTLPKAVHLAGLGLRYSFIMTKDLGLPDRPPRPLSEVIDSYNRFISLSGLPSLPLSTLQFLPRDYVFICGLRCTSRNATDADVPRVYALIAEAASRSEGYSISEVPTEDCFRRFYIGESHCVVHERQEDGDLIAFSIVGLATMVRSKMSKLGEVITCMNPAYRGRRLYREISILELGLTKEAGFIGIANDVMHSNGPILSMMESGADTVVGAVPKSAYVKTDGNSGGEDAGGYWGDNLIVYVNVDVPEILTFTELCDQNEKLVKTMQADNSSKL